MTNTRLREFATELAKIYREIEAKKEEAKALIEAAEAVKIKVKALRRVAKEMNMDEAARRDRYADETDIDQMRMEFGLIPDDLNDRRAA